MATDQIQFAGDYQLQEIVIHAGQKNLDIKPLMLELNIYESIFANNITGSITIADSVNHVQNVPIVGQEEISFKLEIGDGNDIIDFTRYRGRIYKVADQIRSEERQQVYTIFFTASEQITNSRTRVQQAYEGTSDTIATQIVKTILKSNKSLAVEPSTLHVKLLGNNMRPYDFINLLTRRSQSKLNSNAYLYYENHRGLHFRSIHSLSNSINSARDNIIEYVADSTKSNRDVESDMHSLLEYKVMKSQDVLAAYHTGLIASRSYNYNISRKSYDITESNYFSQFNSRKHTNRFPIFSTTEEDINRTLVDYEQPSYAVTSRNEYLHTQSATDTQDYDNHSKKNIDRTFDLLSHDQIKLKCTVPGNTNLAAGDVVKISIPSLEPINKETDRLYDEFYTGRYILTNVVHTLNDVGYNTIFECVTDSVPIRYPVEEKKPKNEPVRGVIGTDRI